jgi:hypothetical protein
MTVSQSKGPWLLTSTSKKFHVLNPSIDELDIVDAASGLSRQCRFNGQFALGSGFDDCIYSVAQHSVYVEKYYSIKYPDDEDGRKWALAHDVSEGWLGDMISPVKSANPVFCSQEETVADLVRRKWSIPYNDQITERVHHCDVAVCILESEVIYDDPRAMWEVPFTPELTLKHLDPQFFMWGPRKARNTFLSRFGDLFDMEISFAQ